MDLSDAVASDTIERKNMLPEHVKKWKSVFELLLSQELRDNADDTLVQKLQRFLNTSAISSQDFVCELWRETAVGAEISRTIASPKSKESLSFALHLVAAFGKVERLFESLSEDNVLTALSALRCLKASVDPNVQIAYISALTSFLLHEPGMAWVAQHALLHDVFESSLSSSYYVHQRAAGFLAAFLCKRLNVDCPQIRQFLEQTVGATDDRHRKECFRILGMVAKENRAAVEILCHQYSLDKQLLDYVTRKPLADAAVPAAELLGDLCRGNINNIDAVATALKQNPGALIKFVSCFLGSRPDVNEPLERHLVQILRSAMQEPLAHPEDFRGTRSPVSTWLCALQGALGNFRHPETVELVADEIAQFVAHSQQANHPTRHLSTALDGFAVALSKLDLSLLDTTKVEGYLQILLSIPSREDLTVHAIKQALDLCMTLAVASFCRGSQDVEWALTTGVEELAALFRRQLVSTRHSVTESALESLGSALADSSWSSEPRNNVGMCRFARWFQENALPRFVWDSLSHPHGGARAAAYLAFSQMCLHDSLWKAFVDDLQLSEVSVVALVSSGVTDESDPFVRHSAAAALSLWVEHDRLGAQSAQREKVRQTASKALGLDLHYMVQDTGLSIWHTYIHSDLDGLKEKEESLVRNILAQADQDGFGWAVWKVIHTSCSDMEVRHKADIFLFDLRERLQKEFGFVPVLGLQQDKMDGCDEGHTERDGRGDFSDDTMTLDRNTALEEVLDLQISECLRKKLREPDESRKTDTLLPDGTDGFPVEFPTEALLARVSKPPSHPEKECDMDSPESLLEDLLAAAAPRLAASAHQDMDCY